MPSAYLLVTHGSRDSRYHRSIAQLVDRVQAKVSEPVGMAVLECHPLELHEQIIQFCEPGYDRIHIIPLFLLPGVHVMQDIPEQVAIAQSQLTTKLTIATHLGSDPRMRDLLAKRFPDSEARILLSHGSRRSQGNLPIETLASELNAIAAFWSVSPSLEDCVQKLSHCQEIAILPYFLFTGGITDAIAQTVEQLSQKFPNLNLQLLTPLEVGEELVNLVVEFIAQQNSPDLMVSSC